MEYLSNFREMLKELIDEGKMTPIELARAIPMPKSAISNYLSGVTKPTVKNLIKIADYFNISCDYLLGITDNKNFVKKNINSTFYENVLFLIRKNFKSVTEFSNKFNYNVYNWKMGQVPYIDTLIRLSEIFGVSVDYLLGRDN